MPPISPHDFVEKWSQSELREQQAAQSHFNDLCALVGHKNPTDLDPKGEFFVFENHVEKATGGKGRADVWYKGHFAWEYKGKHKDLDAAYAQLLAYRGGLDNPPLLVVCDFLEYRIYPQWPNSSGQPFVFRNEDLLNREAQNYIRWLLESPERFLEARLADAEQRQQLTEKLARKFATLADLMRQHRDEEGQAVWDAMQIARFLTKLVFILFTEDIELMPRPGGQRIINYLVEGAKELPEAFAGEVQRLFRAMNGEVTGYGGRAVPYFNGGLFADEVPGSGDGAEALDVTQIIDAIDLMQEVSKADWRQVDPAIFGTLFEGALDLSKRAQLGAHFTSEQDIRLIVEPVLMEPLNRQWDSVRTEAEPLLQTYLNGSTPRAKAETEGQLTALYEQMMTRLEQTTVLDPACGSGNFLYVSLRTMKDLEAKVRKFFEPLGLPFRDVVTPRQLYGIEKDPFAAKLAHVVAWIGYLQWRYEDEGVLHPQLPRSRPHPRQLPHPILRDKNSPDEPDRIQNRDAIMNADGSEPEWPQADVIVGNPPFLGGSLLRGELGDSYYETLTKLYKGGVPGGADLVTYWFEKARKQVEQGKTQRAGLLSTNSIRGGANREVLKRIKDSGDIFMAWADRAWVLDGAAVRVSMVGFDDGTQPEKRLDGEIVAHVNPDLTDAVNITQAQNLQENKNICFRSDEKGGSFDIDAQTAQQMLNAINKNKKSNSDVVRPYYNGLDVTRGHRNVWIIDFGVNVSEVEASQYELPFEYLKKNVKSERKKVRNERERKFWWLHRRPAPDMRIAIENLSRFIATPSVAKHRLFIWLENKAIPDHQLYVFAREDDYFFGVLHSKVHEVWSLRMGTWLGKGNDPRYTPTTTFETFPFPWVPGQEDQSSAAYQAISAAAKSLHEERDAWLNPDDDLLEGPAQKNIRKDRTLTNLYNALNDRRGLETIKVKPDAADFAPRLDELHRALDAAVCVAYGWDDLAESLYTPEGEESILRRLLALNLERAGD